MIEIHFNEIPADGQPVDAVCEAINAAIRQAFGVPHETAATPEAKPEPMTDLDLANALVTTMRESGLNEGIQLKAAWIAMQIVGGVQAAELVANYCSLDIRPDRSWR